MPYLMVLFGLNQTQNSRMNIPINFGQEGIARVSIHSYQFSGLNALGPIFMNIRNQPTTGMYSNKGSSQFPLLIGAIPNFAHDYSVPVTIVEGDNVWNNAHSLDIELLDFNNNPVTLSSGYILFDILTRDPHWPRENPPHDEVKRREFRETVTRNAHPGTKWMIQI